MSDSCLFCRIVRREIPATIIWEDAHTLAFRDLDPRAPTHVLVIPKVHVASLNEADDAVSIGRLSLAAAAIARAEGVSESGFRAVINTGPDAGQSVFHVHLHLLGGRKLAWPPG